MPEKFPFYLSQSVSYLFHPLLMTSLGILIVFFSDFQYYYIPSEVKRMILIVVVAGTVGLPLAFIPFYWMFGSITNIELSDVRQRFIPMFVTSVIYYITYLNLKKIYVPEVIQAFVFGVFIAIFISTIITLRWKISAHTTGVGGLIGLLLGMMVRQNIYHLDFLMLVILLAGLIGFARIWLRSHTPMQVYAGYALGSCILFITMLLY
ncbi:MAG: hypothetical protein ACOC4B_01150 [Bacteroidota bacterium]